MVRWDNILGLLLVVLIIWSVHQLVEVLGLYGDNLRGLYEQTFSPWQRPILKLELLVLAIVLVGSLRRSWRNRREPPSSE